MDENILDKDFKYKWSNFRQDLKVSANGELVFSSITEFVSPKLSEQQAMYLKEVFKRERKNYVFA